MGNILWAKLAKAEADHPGRLWLSLVDHSGDVAAVFEAILRVPTVVRRLAALAGSSLRNVILVLGLLLWDRFAVVTRSATLQVRNLDYVAAAQAVGCSTARIVATEILPNVLNAIVIIATIEMANGILLAGREGVTLVDSGYGDHAPQTLALLDHALAGRPLGQCLAQAWYRLRLPLFASPFYRAMLSSAPAFHSTARRRSVRLTRASVTSGMADSPRSIFAMQPAQLTPSTARSMWA